MFWRKIAFNLLFIRLFTYYLLYSLVLFLFLLGEMNTSAQAHLRVELLNYGTLTQIPIVKSFCLFTSHHTTKPSK